MKLEGEGNVDLHHLHLRYAWRMCHYASTPAEHQFVAVNTKYDHVPAQRNCTLFFNQILDCFFAALQIARPDSVRFVCADETSNELSL